MRRTWLMLAVMVVALAGCGGGGDDGGSGARGGGTGGGGDTSLDIRVTGVGGGTLYFSLNCRAVRCTEAQLDAIRRIVRNRGDQDRACTQIYGGPERAHLTGTLGGESVDVVVDRRDGCGIADYDALFAALERPAPIAT